MEALAFSIEKIVSECMKDKNIFKIGNQRRLNKRDSPYRPIIPNGDESVSFRNERWIVEPDYGVGARSAVAAQATIQAPRAELQARIAGIADKPNVTPIVAPPAA